MKIGVNSFIWTGAFEVKHLSLLPSLREAGFDGVEIARVEWDSFEAGEIREGLVANGLEATVCSALTGEDSLASGDSLVRKRARSLIESSIRNASELGAGVVAGPFVTPVGYLPGYRRSSEEWKRAVEELQGIGETLESSGVRLAIEPLNRFEAYFLNTVEDGVRLCEDIGHDRIGLLVDTFHANIEEKNVAAAFKTAGDRLFHVHVSENDRGIPGTGHIPWRHVLETLRTVGYQDWIVIESFGFRIPEIAKAACIWRDIAPAPEMIAFQGLAFLRRQLED